MSKQKNKAKDIRNLVISLAIIFGIFGGFAWYMINQQAVAPISPDTPLTQIPTITAQLTADDGSTAVMNLDIHIDPGESDLTLGQLATVLQSAATELNLSQVTSTGSITYIQDTLAQAVTTQTGQVVGSVVITGILTS